MEGRKQRLTKTITQPFQLKGLTSMFFVLAALYIACLLFANIIAGKLIEVWYWVLPAGVIVFPATYLFGDILTEVYGWQKTKLVIWTAFAANIFMVLVFWLVIILRYPPFWEHQEAYAQVLGFVPRLVLASLAAYFVGAFTNSTILSAMKKLTRGRFLWLRAWGSTLVGDGLDSLIFITIAFVGTMPVQVLMSMVLAQWIFKFLYEVASTPITYTVVHYLKKKEKVDVYDYGVKYNPFAREKQE